MRLFSLLIILSALTACQTNKKPDLARLYQPIGTDFSNTPLILIHGSLGSKLRLKDSGEEVWPGKIKDLIFSDYRVLANRIEPSGEDVDYSVIESYTIIDQYSGLGVYDEIIETLSEYGGYQLIELNTAVSEKRSLYVFHYDWRQDTVHNAQQLAQFIDQVLAQQPNHQQVDVVAHSLGGLVLRYYQRYGNHDVLPTLMSDPEGFMLKTIEFSQAQKIRHAIFLGTPQLGTVKAIGRLKSGFDFNLSNIPVEVQITMPSVYQLLPHPLSHWAANTAGESVDIDLYDPALWEQNQWSIYDPIVTERILAAADNEVDKDMDNGIDNKNTGPQQVALLQQFFNYQLKRARAFWLALSPAHAVEHEGFIVMGGSCKETLNRVIVTDDNNKLDMFHQARKELGDVNLQKSILFEPGDGQVSKSSLLGQINHPTTHQTLKTVKVKYPVFVCEDHLTLTKNITFQDNLLHVLLNQ